MMKEEKLAIVLVACMVLKCHGSVVLHETVMSMVPAGNYSYYSLAQAGSVLMFLYTHEGDADLYIAQGNTKPTYELDSHDLQSTTCGIDYLQVPQDFRRPISIGVYGHPRHDLSIFELKIIINDTVEPEFVSYSYDSETPELEEKPETKTSYPKPDPMNEQESLLWTILFSVLKIVFDILVD